MPILPPSYWVRRKGDTGIFLKAKDLVEKPDQPIAEDQIEITTKSV
jgi:hypothetical protein